MFQKLKMTSVVVAIVFFLLSLLAVLQYYRFQTLLYEVNSSRISVPTQALKSDIERSLGLGLALQSNVALKSMLETTIERNTDIRSIRLADTKSATAQVLWEAGKPPPLTELQPSVSAHLRTNKEMSFDPDHKDDFVQVWSIRDPIGRVVAALVVRVDNTEARNLLADARAHLLQYWLLLCGATLVCLAPILIYLFSNLDRLINSANRILRGDAAPNVQQAQHSEILDLATQVMESGQSAGTGRR